MARKNNPILSAESPVNGYMNAQTMIEHRLTQIGKLVKAHAKETDGRPNWGQVGDLAKVNDDLKQIERFLGRYGADEGSDD